MSSPETETRFIRYKQRLSFPNMAENAPFCRENFKQFSHTYAPQVLFLYPPTFQMKVTPLQIGSDRQQVTDRQWTRRAGNSRRLSWRSCRTCWAGSSRSPGSCAGEWRPPEKWRSYTARRRRPLSGRLEWSAPRDTCPGTARLQRIQSNTTYTHAIAWDGKNRTGIWWV